MLRWIELLTLLLFLPATTSAQNTTVGNDLGKKLYDKHCSQCHGDTGDGLGVGAPFFKPAPRDFTKAKYKVRTTPNGELPLDIDIRNAIVHGLAFRQGMAFTGMPPWPNFSEAELTALVVYLKSFAREFSDPKLNQPKAIALGPTIATSEESVKKGRKLFEDNECVKCHGLYGRGDGRSAPTLKDDWENHIRPADLTKRYTFRGGGRKEDIYRTISTGFNGTPMPSYADAITEEDRGHLVNYIYSLSTRDDANYNRSDKPVVLRYVSAELPLDDIEKAKSALAEAPVAYIPLVGQVIEPGREFFPGVNAIEVRGLYTDNEVVLLLTWHDMKADISGKNSPQESVVDEKPQLAKPKVEETGGDPFAEESADPFAEDDSAATTTADTPWSDAVAIQIPQTRAEGFIRPYFVFGDAKFPVEIWFSDLAAKTFDVFTGKGSDNITLNKQVRLSSLSKFQDGEWSVIFRRPRKVEAGLEFIDSQFIPVLFSVWDGFNQERGNKRGLSTWYNLYLEPRVKPSVVIPMLRTGGIVLFFEILIVWFVRRRANQEKESREGRYV